MYSLYDHHVASLLDEAVFHPSISGSEHPTPTLPKWADQPRRRRKSIRIAATA